MLIPTASNPHELCVTSGTTGRGCQDFAGGPDTTLTVSYKASASMTSPTVDGQPCPGGLVLTVSTGGGTLSGGATVSSSLIDPVTLPIEPTSSPADTVSVS